MGTGILGYGVSFPYYRINPKEIYEIWMKNVLEAKVNSQGLSGRGVMGPDEDTITLAVDASQKALDMAGIEPSRVGALFVGTQTNPYTTKSIASVLGDMLMIGPEVMSGDCQFSGKSGTMALQAIWSMVKAEVVDYGLMVAADALNLHVAPGNPLEYTAAAGSAALLIGREGVIAEIEATTSYASDATDYFRLDEERYISWGGSAMSSTRVGLPTHLQGAVKLILSKLGLRVEDFSYAAMPQESTISAHNVGRLLGFSKDKMAFTIFADKIGDCGCATPIIGLAKALEKASEGDRILMGSYGYGAGSDAFSIIRTGASPKRTPRFIVDELLARNKFVDYATSLKYERKLQGPAIKVSPHV